MDVASKFSTLEMGLVLYEGGEQGCIWCTKRRRAHCTKSKTYGKQGLGTRHRIGVCRRSSEPQNSKWENNGRAPLVKRRVNMCKQYQCSSITFDGGRLRSGVLLFQSSFVPVSCFFFPFVESGVRGRWQQRKGLRRKCQDLPFEHKLPDPG